MRPRGEGIKNPIFCGHRLWSVPCGRGPVPVVAVFAVTVAGVAAVCGADPVQVREDDVGLDDGAVASAELHRVVSNLLQVDDLKNITLPCIRLYVDKH